MVGAGVVWGVCVQLLVEWDGDGSLTIEHVHPQVAPKASVPGKERSAELKALSKKFAMLHGLSSAGKT